jgi:hypothetical protein
MGHDVEHYLDDVERWPMRARLVVRATAQECLLSTHTTMTLGLVMAIMSDSHWPIRLLSGEANKPLTHDSRRSSGLFQKEQVRALILIIFLGVFRDNRGAFVRRRISRFHATKTKQRSLPASHHVFCIAL